MKKFDLVMFNMSSFAEWEEGVSNRNFHVLQQLMQSENVGKIIAVDYLPLTFKRALRNFKENIILHLKSGEVVKKSFTSKLTKVSDKLYIYSDVDFFWRPKKTLARIKKITWELNFGDWILWSYLPYVAPYCHNLGQKLTVFEAVDNWLKHSSYQKHASTLKESYKIIKDQADLIFTVSENLLNFFDNQANVYWIPNGVDWKHYNKHFSLVNRDIADIPKPIIGYIGVIQDRVDLDLIAYLAKANPDKSFVLVGPVWSEQDLAQKNLSQYPNIHFLGYKSYQEAPMYIQQFSLGLIPHQKADFSVTTNPMKMYEYLAAGLSVVASTGAGTENIENFVEIAESYEDFNKKINILLAEDSQEKQNARKEYVKQHSWVNAVNKMLELINNKLS
ncbi:MAG: hypothetical protein UR94_C0013G0016 [Parcubacteria group bacterium GW2011_GWA2_36_10]|nr:MAG: hypothetical protein UR94_C0013G0016 [Parcubacteria group bacterium GW2011_GWA2_36_10]